MTSWLIYCFSLFSLVFYFWLIIVVCIVLKLMTLNGQYRKSNYQKISGNNFFKTIFDKGNYGEYLTFSMLKKAGENNILTNIYLPQKDGTTTEIDLLVVNTSGIYVFESKNYSGWIYGNENDKTWTQSLNAKKKYKFLNPIWQNKLHISTLNEYFENKFSYSFYSYIIFSERCELKKIAVYSTNVTVLKRHDLVQHFLNQTALTPNKLTEEQVNYIYEKLKAFILVDEDTKKKHIEDIQTKHSA